MYQFRNSVCRMNEVNKATVATEVCNSAFVLQILLNEWNVNVHVFVLVVYNLFFRLFNCGKYFILYMHVLQHDGDVSRIINHVAWNARGKKWIFMNNIQFIVWLLLLFSIGIDFSGFSLCIRISEISTWRAMRQPK